MDNLFDEIVKACFDMKADGINVITEFGVNKDLTLYIHKDCDFKSEIDENAYNIVNISTKQGDTFVDDTEDIHVTDVSLYEELERIYNYMNFQTL